MAAPANLPVACPNCGKPFPFSATELAAVQACPACERQTIIVVYPAYDHVPPAGAVAEAVVVEGEATCFYHPQKRAHVPCDGCGRFLCAMCDLDLGGQHLCPQCLETGVKKGKVGSLERARVRWDQIVSSLLVIPLVLLLCGIGVFLMPITAVAVLVIIAWKWKATGSQIVNTRLHFVVCGILALLEIAGGIGFWLLMFRGKF